VRFLLRVPGAPGTTRQAFCLLASPFPLGLAGLNPAALQTFQPGNLIALFGDVGFRERNFAKQFQQQVLSDRNSTEFMRA